MLGAGTRGPAVSVACVGLDGTHMDVQGPRSCLCALSPDSAPRVSRVFASCTVFLGRLSPAHVCPAGDTLFCPPVSGEEAETGLPSVHCIITILY